MSLVPLTTVAAGSAGDISPIAVGVGVFVLLLLLLGGLLAFGGGRDHT
jgi:hypothetical protein